jgi:hypothetical protein
MRSLVKWQDVKMRSPAPRCLRHQPTAYRRVGVRRAPSQTQGMASMGIEIAYQAGPSSAPPMT